MRKPTGGLVLLVALSSAGCGSDQAGRAERASGWVAHKGARYALETPRGWNVRAEPRSGPLDIQGTAREQVVVWPVFVPGSLDAASAPAVLRKLAGSVWNEARREAAEPQGGAAVRARGRTVERLTLSALTWVASSRGSAAYFYALAAPEPS